MPAVTLGHTFSDQFGTPLLPFLCSEEGDFIGEYGPDDDANDKGVSTIYPQNDPMGHCHICSKTEQTRAEAYKAVILASNELLWAMNDVGEVVTAEYANCNVVFDLCEGCESRVMAIARTSDHVCFGKDWWEMLEHIRQLVNDPAWFDWRETKHVRSAVCSLIGCAYHSELPVFCEIPVDCFRYIVLPHLIEGVRDNCARKIQSLWKRYIGKFEEVCEDCGKRQTRDSLESVRATSHYQLRPCSKLICSEHCEYVCRNCNAVNHQLFDGKSCDGTSQTDFCWRCFNPIEFFEYWD